ncbi:hypothetical protein [Streptomyces sp. NPDC058613]|uniref:hypothetical protein n=1 Tax=Streptomyces sp. NPDC058613 TaxID=3346556 RepID=UPI00365FF8C9
MAGATAPVGTHRFPQVALTDLTTAKNAARREWELHAGPVADVISSWRRRAAGSWRGTGPAVTRASLQADLANAGARSARLAARVHQLEERLSKTLGDEIWRTSGLGAPADIADLTSRITQLEQRNVELIQALEERQDELNAARAANRDLTRALNHRD